MKYLIDTNIFLEILLQQDKSNLCKSFLENNIGSLHISDFSLHSIGVILFKQDKAELFQKFLTDVIPKIYLLSLPKTNYESVINYRNDFNLDFDDAYQCSLSNHYRLKIVTMDKDFEKVKNLPVEFL